MMPSKRVEFRLESDAFAKLDRRARAAGRSRGLEARALVCRELDEELAADLQEQREELAAVETRLRTALAELAADLAKLAGDLRKVLSAILLEVTKEEPEVIRDFVAQLLGDGHDGDGA